MNRSKNWILTFVVLLAVAMLTTGCGNSKHLTIKGNVSVVGESAYENNAKLESVVIEEGVTEIAKNAFNGCATLKSVTLPSTLRIIGNGAFDGCKNLTDIVLPEGLERIGDSAFRWCSELTSVSIPSTVQDIGTFAFIDCGKLTSVKLPEQLNKLGPGAFSGTPFGQSYSAHIPESFENAVDWEASGATIDNDALVMPLSIKDGLDGNLYTRMPEDRRTLSPEAADFILVVDHENQQRLDYIGRAYDTYTNAYLCGNNGTILRLCSIRKEPKEKGYESLYGAEASADEIWDAIRAVFE